MKGNSTPFRGRQTTANHSMHSEGGIRFT
jgi:hypothetical protein